MNGSDRRPLAAISALGLGESVRSGLDRYTRTVLEGLLPSEEFVCFASADWLLDAFPGRALRGGSKGLQRNNFRGNLGRLAWHQTKLPRRLRRLAPRLFYCPVSEGMLAPVVPQVTTIHDLLPLRYPDVYPRLKHYYRHILPRIVRGSRAIIADSEATRADVERVYAPAGPVYVIHPGYDEKLFRAQSESEVAATVRRYGLERYLLTVAEARPYKNIGRLIEAFARVQAPGVTLAICGSIDRLEPGLSELPARLGVGDRVRFLGYVEDADLPRLYSGALAFVFPSLYEGFGLPPLEAMACGCPVVASTAASIPEVCGDAAVYVHPERVESIASGVETILSDESLRSRLRYAGLQRARRFEPGSFVSRIGEVLHEVAEAAEARRRGAGAASFVNEAEAVPGMKEKRTAPVGETG